MKKYIIFVENKEGVKGYCNASEDNPKIVTRADAHVFESSQLAEKHAAHILTLQKGPIVRAEVVDALTMIAVCLPALVA